MIRKLVRAISGIVLSINGAPLAQAARCVRIIREEIVELQADGTMESAVADLGNCKDRRRTNMPEAVWNHDVADPDDYWTQRLEMPLGREPENAFRAQWEMFLRRFTNDEPFRPRLEAQLAELHAPGTPKHLAGERRWIDVPEFEVARQTSEKESGLA